MLHVVLMIGGAGTRFWPQSREKNPKYLLPIIGEKSMLIQTIERVSPLVRPENIYCITSESQAPIIRKLLPDVPQKNIVAEPMGRDSAACVALAALIISDNDPDGVMLCTPGDSLVQHADAFRKAVNTGESLALINKLVTFGIKPHSPETRFGYIRRGQEIPTVPGAYQVQQFVEKPQREAAEQMMKSGEYYWNSGNFIWRADTILREFARYSPAHYEAMERIRPALGTDKLNDKIREEYEKLPKISIDYAVMEKAQDVVVVEAEFDWDDVGGWTALEAHNEHDACGNTCIGKCVTFDSKGCVIVTDQHHLTAVLGLEDVIVIHTPDATLVCPKDRAEDVKKLVDHLKARGLQEYT